MVTDVTPQDNSQRVSPAASLTVTFSEPVDCASVGSQALSLLDGATPIPGATTCSGNQITFTPGAALPTNTTLTASVSTAVTDRAGNHLASAFTWHINVAAWTVQSGTEGADELQAVAVDASGNIYAVGYAGGSYDGHPNAGLWDAVIVKFDAAGNRQWSRLLGAADYDSAYAVALDSSGNVYVGGTMQDGSGTTGMFVARYSGAGQQVWLRQFQTDDITFPRAMVFEKTGTLTVVGYTGGSLFAPYAGGNSDLFVMKLDVTGSLLWGRQFGTASTDNAAGLAVNPGGDIFVAGYTYGALDGNASAGDADYFLVKYDGLGNRLWTKQMGTAAADIASGIASDGAGHLYVVGRTGGSLGAQAGAGGLDAFVAKFDESGVPLWVTQFGSAADDRPLGIAVDAAGNASIAGYTLGALDGNAGAGNADPFVARLDAAGRLLWARQWGSAANDYAFGIALDPLGNAIIAGSTEGSLDGNVSAGQADMSITKVTPDGIRR